MKGKVGSMIAKIDLEKAFDKIEWSFVRHTLHYFGFPLKIINLIMYCISTNMTVILYKGTRTNFFNTSRGLRQGDPLSLYLFILCTEVLSHQINVAVTSKHWSPIKISP